MLRSFRPSLVRCWLEQDGNEIGVIMFDVGVNPVEVMRLSNPMEIKTLEGVSISIPVAEVVLTEVG